MRIANKPCSLYMLSDICWMFWCFRILLSFSKKFEWIPETILFRCISLEGDKWVCCQAPQTGHAGLEVPSQDKWERPYSLNIFRLLSVMTTAGVQIVDFQGKPYDVHLSFRLFHGTLWENSVGRVAVESKNTWSKSVANSVQWAHFKNSLFYNQCLILEAGIINKNAEQTSTWGFILVRFLLIFLIFIRSPIWQRFLLFMTHYGKVQGTQTQGNI